MLLLWVTLHGAVEAITPYPEVKKILKYGADNPQVGSTWPDTVTPGAGCECSPWQVQRTKWCTMHRKYSDLRQWQLFTSMCWRRPLPWWLPLQRLWQVRDKAQRSQLASQRCIKDEGGCTDNNQCPGFDSVCNIPAHDNCFFCDLPSENCLEGKESNSHKSNHCQNKAVGEPTSAQNVRPFVFPL